MDKDYLESFGNIRYKSLTKAFFNSLIEEFQESSELLLDKPNQIAAPLWQHGHIAGALCVVDRQFKENVGEFTAYDKAILTALAATASIALEKSAIEIENRHLKSRLSDTVLTHPMIGAGPAIQKVYADIEKIAGQDIKISVLIRGESGTGKELVAKSIHQLGPRKDKPFIPINCAAIPKDLLESELFGHERGAFTGAVVAKVGKIEAANGGTLFLDEIGEMSPELQAKLLRVLEDGSYSKVGSAGTSVSDFQLISATNKQLEQAVEAGDFREDLFYRLKTIQIVVPPLKERLEDIELLAKYFLTNLNDVSTPETDSGDYSPGAVRVKKISLAGQYSGIEAGDSAGICVMRSEVYRHRASLPGGGANRF